MSWPHMADRMLGVAMRVFAHRDQAGQSVVQYRPKGGASYTIEATFDNSHAQVDASTGVQVSSTNPILGVRLSQLAALPQKGDRVSVAGTLYAVVDYQPDGVAGANLELEAI